MTEKGLAGELDCSELPEVLGRDDVEGGGVLVGGLEVKVTVEIDPVDFFNLCADGEVQLFLEIEFARNGAVVAGAELVHATIDGRDVDVEVGSVGGQGVKAQTRELLEVQFLHDQEGVGVPKALIVMVLAAGLVMLRQ